LSAIIVPKLFLALGSKPLATNPVWTEMAYASPARSRLRSGRINRRLGSEGTCELVVDNRDRALEPEYAGSPYYPNVIPNTRLQLVLPSGTVVFDGYIDSVLPSYTFGPAGGGDAVVTIRATDLTKLLARYRVQVPYDREVTLDGPVHWWPLGEATGSKVFQDNGSTPTTGSYVTPTLGERPVVQASSSTSLLAGSGVVAEAHFPVVQPPYTTECVVDAIKDMPTSDGYQPLLRIGPMLLYISATQPPSVYILPSATFLPGGGFSGGDGSIGQPVRVDLPLVATFTVTSSLLSFYANGVLVGSYTLGAQPPIPLDFAVAGGRGYLPTQGPVFLTGRVGHLSVYPSVLSAARIAAHVAAARAPWANESTGARVARLCNIVGIPAGQQSIDVGATSGLGSIIEPVGTKTALDLARQVERTEQGRMFATADGKWRFASRRSLNGVAVSATFGDGGGSELPYTDLVEEFDEKTIINRSTVTREGGNPQTYTDPTIGPTDPLLDFNASATLYASDPEAYDAAAWYVIQNKAPHLRFKSLRLPGERSAAHMTQVAARDIGDKLTVLRRPPGGGSPQTKTVVIEGVAHSIDLQRQTWQTTYELAPVDGNVYWTLEDSASALGTNTALAF